MLEIIGAEKFFADLDKAVIELEAYVVDQYRTFCYGVFYHLVSETPQWTGNAAANWNVSTGSPDTESSDWVLQLAEENPESEAHKYPVMPGGPFRKGHEQAVAMALAANDTVFPGILLTDKVFLANSAENLKGESYIFHLETNPSNFLRPENDGGGMVRRTVETFESLHVTKDFKQLSLPYGGFTR